MTREYPRPRHRAERATTTAVKTYLSPPALAPRRPADAGRHKVPSWSVRSDDALTDAVVRMLISAKRHRQFLSVAVFTAAHPYKRGHVESTSHR